MKRIALFMALVMMLSLVVGCGGDKPTSTPGTSTPATSTTKPSEVTPPAANVKYEETVVIGQNAKTTTTVPQNQTNIAHRMMFALTHNTLVGYVEKAKELQPELAKEWKVSDDLKTWTFTLRDDVVFHNGEKFTADDVVYTWERALSAEGVSGTVKSAYAAMESVKANGDYEVVITLKEGNIDLLYTLSNEYMAILNREACTADATNGGSIGTGAWINKEFVSGDHTTLNVNEKYWAEVPVTKVLEFRYISEGSARLIALENDEIDVCQSPNNTEHKLIKENKDLILEAYPSSALTYLSFNMDSFLGEDENLRLAIAHALNNDAIIQGAASGFGTVANSMWGIDQYGYFDAWESVGQTTYNNNMEKAKEYMAKSKYATTGVDIKFMTSTAWRVKALQIMMDQLKPLGINVIVDEVDAAGLTSRSNTGDFEVLMYSITFTPAGSDVKRIFYPGSSTNNANYNNARVTELLDLAGAEQDDAKRKGYYQEVQEIIHKEAPYIPLYYANSGAAYDKNLESAIFNNSGNHDYTYARIPA